MFFALGRRGAPPHVSAAVAVVTNIAAYLFASLSDLKPLRERLLAFCKARHLKGTILLAPEGINLFVAGGEGEIGELLVELRAIPGLEALEPKVSHSDHQPFSRMLVRLKKEIIAFGVEGIEPAKYTSPRLEARTLKQWLDEGKPVLLYDTRNDYEVKLGTFKGAIAAGIDHFRDFPEAVAKLPEDMKDAPVVTFCTGGIRCEKAAPFMERAGFKNVYQLEGGILKYFEEVGGDHYDGECFVFDQRVGVDPALRETTSDVCFACQTPLEPAEQEDPRYVAGVSCPHCYQPDEERQAEQIKLRQAALHQVSHPLPGSVPYDNHCPVRISTECDGMTLLDALCHLFAHVERSFWEGLFVQGRLLTREGDPVSPDIRVRSGENYLRLLPATVEPVVSTDIRVLHEDECIVVLHKPAPLPMHPSGRYHRHSLQWLVNAAWDPERPRAVHRLDANTTGIVVFGRTRRHAGKMQEGFKKGAVEKVYLVRVQGHPEWETFTCDAPISRESSRLGARTIDEEDGHEARTEFKVLSRDADGSALLEARPLTGRTNQIRVHLWQLGHPVQGDPAYLADGSHGDKQTLDVGDAPLCLHAWKLAFDHPRDGQRMEFVDEPPAWAGV
ncbi:hypothetical protein llg_32160 [Luteolibacter sp. LG18]|nr:hypothetical protein llg_32160 [Luteolibacter sp. LG18]